MAWKGYGSYGDSALGADFQVSGLDELLEKVKKAGDSIDDAVSDAVKEAAPILLESQKDGAARHRKGAGKYGTDAVYDALESGHISQEGNYTYISVGIDLKIHPEAKHAVFQEYGDGHSPEFPDPFIRPSVDENRGKVKSAIRNVLKKRSVPID
ncbi:MAG: HK97 gp10 family phage protein [Clostridia bacterium]|nr:HK97 gp10 family phage protein [Clostridia bacterium]